MKRVDQKRSQIEAAVSALACPIPGVALTVRAVMTPAPSCIVSDSTLLDIIHLYQHKRFRHLLVTDVRRRVLGVVSDRDVLRYLGPGERDEEKLRAVSAAEIMSTDVITINCEASLAEAAYALYDHGINCLPVESDGRLVGIVTSTDLYLALAVLLEGVSQCASEPVAAIAG
jgi:acetoin utilization protein AcuB